MKKKSFVLLLLVMAVALAACGSPEEETAPEEAPAEQAPAEEESEAPGEMQTGLAPVDSVTVERQGDQWVATVSGNLPDGCTEISSTSHSASGSTISIIVETQRPADMMCDQALKPYTEQVILDTSDLEKGRYAVKANGVTAEWPVVISETTEAPAESGDVQILIIV